MTGKIYTETPRLIVRAWQKSDFIPFCRMNADSDVMEFFLDILSHEQSKEMYNRMQKEFVDYGYGAYAIEEKASGKFIGFTGFHNVTFEADFTPAVEILWRLLPQFWGKGYATEAAKACLRYAKENLPFDEIYSFTTITNKRSEKVMQKAGMTKEYEFAHPDVPEGHPLRQHVLYKIEL